MSAAAELEFTNVTKIFRHRPSLFNLLGRERAGETIALREVSLNASTGEVLVLLGPNGSGKSTLLKLVSTILLPDEGRILVGGFDTQSQGNEVRRRIGFAVANERSFFPRLTAQENLNFFAVLENVAGSERRARIKDVFRSTGLTDAADTLVMKFTSGMYQRLGIARALLKQPRVLLLDEPTRSLDPRAVLQFWDLVRAISHGNTAIVLATHSFDDATAVGDSVAILREGTLVAKRALGRSLAAELRDFYFTSVEGRAAVIP